jgi:hypothetical protein
LAPTFLQSCAGQYKIENNAERSFKESGEMRGNTKTLKGNNEEREGILIGPSMAPRFFTTEIPSRAVLAARELMSVSGTNLAVRMANGRPKALKKRGKLTQF